jgi:hypothetical protein|tara:strand:- start:1506 stop:1919 length:414 start_codon:yes stop_codon:yes gene_type:complete
MDIIWANNNNEMINKFFDKLLLFIDSNNADFKLNTDNGTLFKNFSIFLYDNFILNNYNSDIILNKNYEYFDLKYCSDIVDLFIDFKEISYGFTNSIFNKNKTSLDLIEFIYKNIELFEDFENSSDIEEDEYTDGEYY